MELRLQRRVLKDLCVGLPTHTGIEVLMQDDWVSLKVAGFISSLSHEDGLYSWDNGVEESHLTFSEKAVSTVVITVEFNTIRKVSVELDTDVIPF